MIERLRRNAPEFKTLRRFVPEFILAGLAAALLAKCVIEQLQEPPPMGEDHYISNSLFGGRTLLFPFGKEVPERMIDVILLSTNSFSEEINRLPSIDNPDILQPEDFLAHIKDFRYLYFQTCITAPQSSSPSCWYVLAPDFDPERINKIQTNWDNFSVTGIFINDQPLSVARIQGQ